MGSFVALEGIQSRSQTLISRDAVAVIARIVPDVTGVDKVFDYLVPESLSSMIEVGDRVRVPLHNRNVAGWVVQLGDAASPFSDLDPSRLLSIVKRLGKGPSTDVVQLALWASHRWSGRLRALFVAASPSTLVATLPGSRYTHVTTRSNFESDHQVADLVHTPATALVRRAPGCSPKSIVQTVAHDGPTLVVIPTLSRARLMAASLRAHGLSVAVMPQDWAVAAGGVDVIIGARSAVWASAPLLKSIVVIDEHDDALQEERSPSWHARDIAVQRASQLGIACLLVSPTPSLRSLHLTHGVVWHLDPALEKSQWPVVRLVDRRLDEKWSNSLFSSELIEQLRDHSRRVVCVLNVKGRAKLLACALCRMLTRCETCDAAMTMAGESGLECPRCGLHRPTLCLGCGSGKLAVLKPGISQLRQQLAASAGRPIDDVVEVSTDTDVEIDQRKMLFVGTEAVLHRVREVDTVIFLDIDQEICAPRYRAAEITLTLVVHAARLVGRSNKSGVVMIQTMLADHPLLQGLCSHDLSEYSNQESSRRALMGLPPHGGLAQLSGSGVEEVADQLKKNILLQVSSTSNDCVLVKSADWNDLADALASTTVLKGARIKIQVDPPRA